MSRGMALILKELEMKIKLCEAVIARMTALKSFLTNKSVTISALEALNKLVINVNKLIVRFYILQ